MEFINFSDALTITQEIEVHPNFKPSLFYRNARIKCPNDGCNQKICLSNWFKHIKSTCDHRLVQCPAIKCKDTGTPNDIFTHSIQCPFHTVWCSGCKINWTVLATGHNCEKSKEYNKLRGNNYHLPRYLEPTEDGAVVLKSTNSINKTSDNRALDQIELLVTEYRYKENMRQFTRRLATVQRAKTPLSLIDENTQLTTLH